MVNCCVPGCYSHQKNPNSKGVSYHELPGNPELRAIWIQSLQCATTKENWSPSGRARVCSRHFTQDDYKEGLKIRVLKPGAIPTMFYSSPRIYPSRRGRPKKRIAANPDGENAELLSSGDSNNSNVSSSRPICEYILEQSEHGPGEHSYSYITSFMDGTVERKNPYQITDDPSAEEVTGDDCSTPQMIADYERRLAQMRKKLDTLNQKLRAYDGVNIDHSKLVETLEADANKGVMMAKFLANQLNAYNTKVPVWDEDIMRHCLIWQLKSPQGYEFARNSGILKLPSIEVIQAYVSPSGVENETQASPQELTSLCVDSCTEVISNATFVVNVMQDGTEISRTYSRNKI